MDHTIIILRLWPLLIILVSQGVSALPKLCNDSLSNCYPGEICSLDGFCTCPGSPFARQVYDDFEGKCVLLVGENCDTHEDCVASSTCHPEWNSELHRFQGKCRCASGSFFENVTTGTCDERAEFGQSCSELLPCQLSHLLSCHPTMRTCQCLDSHTQRYDPFKKSCVLKLGENCYDHRRHTKTICPQNAECVFFFNKRKTPRCECFKGFIQTTDRGCEAGFGLECNSTSLCLQSSGLICSDGICQCDSPLTQLFNDKLVRCVEIAGAPCDTKPDCIPHAICHEGTCRCRTGYSKTSEGTCMREFGESCGWGHEPRCNSDAGLACKDGICKCFDSQKLIYDQEAKLCRLKSLEPNTNAGSHFSKISVCGLNGDKNSNKKYPVRCPKGYECLRESHDLECSCGTRGHPHHRVDNLCLRNEL